MQIKPQKAALIRSIINGYLPHAEILVSSLKNCLKKFEAIFLDAGALISR